MRNVLISALIGLILPLAGAVSAEDTATMAKIRQWKAVFGKIEARNTVPARAQLGGTLTKIGVSEGSDVSEGQQIATVYDAKLALQLGAARPRSARCNPSSTMPRPSFPAAKTCSRAASPPSSGSMPCAPRSTS